MTRVRTAPTPQSFIIGAFLFLLAAVFAVAPLPLFVRSLGIVLATYLAFSSSGLPFAYAIALLAPPVGLVRGDADWLVMLPIMLASGLLGVLGLEYAWRYPALFISPLLTVVPPLFVWLASQRALFAVALPWSTTPALWTSLHGLVAAAGVLTAIALDRRRERLESP